MLLAAACLLLPQRSFSQPTKKDSLSSLIKKAKHDTTRAALYLALASTDDLQPDSMIVLCKKAIGMIDRNLDKAGKQRQYSLLSTRADALNRIGDAYDMLERSKDAFEYYQQALVLGKKIGYKKGEGTSLCHLGNIYLGEGQADKAKEHLEQGYELFKSIGYKKGLSTALNDIGYLYSEQGDLDKALEYYLRSMKLNEELGDKKSLALSFNNVASIYETQGKVKEAFDHYGKGLKIYEELKDRNGSAILLNNIGYLYNQQGRVPEALEFYHRSLKIREAMSDKEGMAASLNNIGAIYSSQGQLDEALKYYQRGLKLREEIGNKSGIALMHNNIGKIYQKKGEIEKALENYSRSLKVREEMGDKPGISSSLNSMASIYIKQKNPGKAMECYKRSLALREEIGDKEAIASSLYLVGKLMVSQKKWNEAYTYASRSLGIAQELGFPKEIMDASRLLSDIHAARGEGMKALDMHKLYIQMRDSINNIETQKAAVSNQLKYEYDKKAAADSVAFAKEKEVKDAELAKRHAELKAKKNQQYALLGGLGLVLLFAGFMVNRYKVTQKQKTIIEQQKHVVEEKNKEITDSINYAKRIQAAILPPQRVISELLPGCFVLYKPKDIVAGDFYWLEKKDDAILLAAADCTGHGVPGAMVSVICNNGLNKSVREHGLSEPGKILDKTREIVISEFGKSEEDVKDGMDASLCAITFNGDNATVQWAGANNPLWFIKDGALNEIKAHKQPIGKIDDPKEFPTHTIHLSKGDWIYLFTDGYADQFGGEKGKKFKYSQLKELLLGIHNEAPGVQRERLDAAFTNWKGGLEQVDDVCVLGVRV